MVNRSFAAGILFAILLVGCAGFSYKHYGLDLRDVPIENLEKGKLLGPKEKDDRPLSDCSPNIETNYPCAVMFADEFYKLKEDYLRMREQLKACQKKNP